MKNVVVKVTSREHGAEVIQAFNDLGVDTRYTHGTEVGWYYGLFDGVFNYERTPLRSQVITLKELKAMKNPYPKVMWVWDSEEIYMAENEVIGEIEREGVKGYLIFDGADFYSYRNAKDIEEPIEMKTPMQEFFEFMHQNQYFIGNDLLAKYKELLEKEKEVILLSHINGQSEFDMGARRTENDNLAEQYYNQTFNTQAK